MLRFVSVHKKKHRIREDRLILTISKVVETVKSNFETKVNTFQSRKKKFFHILVFDGQIFQKTVVVWWFCFPGEESALSATGSRLYAHCLTKIICMNTLDLLLSDKQ